MPADDFTWKVGNATQIANKPRILEARFGGGYRQRSGDGPNNLQLTLNVSINVTNQTEVAAIQSFLATKSTTGARWLWTPPAPYGAQRSWICDDWTPVWVEGLLMSFTAIFEEVTQF
jgi:phage-related protein